MRIIHPQNHVSVTPNTVFELTVDKLYAPLTDSVTTSIQFSDVQNFSTIASTVNVSEVTILDGSNTVITGDTIPSTHRNKKIKVRCTYNQGTKTQFFRLKITQGGEDYYTNSLLYTSNTGPGVITSNVRTTDFLPEYISFNDMYTIMGDSSGISVKVEVCNNGHDVTPAWENATISYLTNTPHKFTNTVRAGQNYGVRVKYTITKNKANSNFILYTSQFIVT